jgi:hypothetical protein
MAEEKSPETSWGTAAKDAAPNEEAAVRTGRVKRPKKRDRLIAEVEGPWGDAALGGSVRFV